MVDKTTVEYVSNLAKIEVNEGEKEYLAGHLSKIVDYIDKLRELDTEEVEPLRSLREKTNIFRKDQAKDSQKQKLILENAPSISGDHFKIPRIIG
jgi:aspartyl-tRNA(Asn)/glutamyl-tRNA(Gln) amidotransferase subunit C